MHKWLYRIKNLPALLRGMLVIGGAEFGAFFGAMAGYGILYAKLIKSDGTVVDYGMISARVITDAGVAFLTDDWLNGTKDITNFNAHACGTGVGAEAVGNTALGTEVETRVSGTKSKPTAPQLQTVGTQSMTGTRAITEHGIFDSTTVGGSTLWDRSVFAAINVVSGDSIQWTYVCTVNSGG